MHITVYKSNVLNMIDQSDLHSNKNEMLCDWCGKSFDSGNMVKESVCVRCYKLLSTAGIMDKEIFSLKSNETDNALNASAHCNNELNNK